MPWLTLGAMSNFAHMDGKCWHIEVVGPAEPDLQEYAAANDLAVLDIGSGDVRQYGLSVGAMFLIRPDGHIAVATTRQSAELLEEYRRRHALTWRASRTNPEIAPAAVKESKVHPVSR